MLPCSTEGVPSALGNRLRSFRVSIIHQTLTWSFTPLPCVRDHSDACIYTHRAWLGTLTASQHNIFDPEKLSQIFPVLLMGFEPRVIESWVRRSTSLPGQTVRGDQLWWTNCWIVGWLWKNVLCSTNSVTCITAENQLLVSLVAVRHFQLYIANLAFISHQTTTEVWSELLMSRPPVWNLRVVGLIPLFYILLSCSSA